MHQHSIIHEKSRFLILAMPLILLLGFGLHHLVEGHFSFYINKSESLPFHVFIGTKLDRAFLQRGDYVCFRHPKITVKVAKQVVGLPGDKIHVHEGHAIVNGKDCGIILPESPRTHCTLTPIQSQTIPAGFIYAYAPHAESFDSRYSDFGLIHMHDLLEVLWPLF